MTAQAIAGELARFGGFNQDSALAQYAETGRGSNHVLREEYLLIHHDPSTPELVRELVAWLGSRLVAEENPVARPPSRPRGATPVLSTILWYTATGEGEDALNVHVPADMPTPIIDCVGDRLTPLVDALGEPFVAFLQLPDVDATAHNLQQTFDEFYIGSFDDREAPLRGLTEFSEWEREINRLCHEQGIPEGVVTIDQDELWLYAEGGWDIVTGRDGRLHVFTT